MTIVVDRELTLQDVLRLSVLDATPKVAVPAVQRLRTIHHRIAQAIASGTSDVDVARVCDITPERITQLRTDPSFRDLVAYYSEQVAEGAIDAASRVQNKLLEAGELALDSMIEQLEENPRAVAIGERRQIVQLALDRTVAPPKTAAPTANTPVTVTFNMGSKDLESKAGPLIEHEPATPEPETSK